MSQKLSINCIKKNIHWHPYRISKDVVGVEDAISVTHHSSKDLNLIFNILWIKIKGTESVTMYSKLKLYLPSKAKIMF